MAGIKEYALNHIKPKKIILFESYPDFSCNTEPVYQYLKKQLKGYKMIWICNNKNGHLSDRECIDRFPDKKMDMLKLWYYRLFCKVAISSNTFIKKLTAKQYSLFLCHGSKTKKTKGIYEMGNSVDFINVQSHFFDDIITYEYGCNKDQLVYLGYPRCDCFSYERNSRIAERLLERPIKYVIWLPTFRKQKSGRDDGYGSQYTNIGMPLIYSSESLRDLNGFLKENSLGIIYKPHPAQDVSALRAESLSNIKIIDDSLLISHNLPLYEVIANSEALITDYSSVFFDYLLLDRPIATTTDDIAIWKQNRGFAFDIEKIYDDATVRVGDIKGLKDFLLDVKNGIDINKNTRCVIRDLTNLHKDGNSAQRVGKFVLDLLNH